LEGFVAYGRRLTGDEPVQRPACSNSNITEKMDRPEDVRHLLPHSQAKTNQLTVKGDKNGVD
jgi:hypothetical protein